MYSEEEKDVRGGRFWLAETHTGTELDSGKRQEIVEERVGIIARCCGRGDEKKIQIGQVLRKE